MKFGPRPVVEARNTILAHSVKLEQKSLKKGRLLNEDDLRLLSDAGYEEITVASLEQNDIHEDMAVRLIAEAILGKNVSIGKAFTGRCNLYAKENGLLKLNSDILNQLNLQHESLTIATLEPYTLVVEKQMLATIKAIPFAVQKKYLDKCLELLKKNKNNIQVLPFQAKKTVFIQTRLSGTKETILDKSREVLQRRLQKLGSSLNQETRCEHTVSGVSKAITEINLKEIDLIVISGASAVVDRRDIIPASIEQAGGEIEHFGMPVDPGNLLLLARYKGTPVIGMPGCARSKKENGFDWVLERLFAGIPVAAKDIMMMGVGGLLKDIPSRVQSRIETTENRIKPISKTKLACLVLAAGKSSRMGSANKLLLELDGKTMLEQVLDTVIAADMKDITVITGDQHKKVEKLIENHLVRTKYNPEYEAGMSTSLRYGMDVLDKDISAVLICLADMPRVTTEDIKKLVEAYDPVEGREICVPVYQGKRGNPILWSSRFFAEIKESKGDMGARRLLEEYEELVCEVPMSESGVLIDFDTEQALIEMGYQIQNKAQ